MVASLKIVAATGSRLPTTDMESQFIKAIGDVTRWRAFEVEKHWRAVGDESVFDQENRCMVASHIGL